MKSKQKITLYIMIAIIAIYLVGVAAGFYNTEFQKKPIVQEKFEEGDVEYLYDFYISTTPTIENRPSFGDQNAPITLIMYTNPNSDAFGFFLESLFPRLKEEFIDTGKLQFYHKHYLSEDDLLDATDALDTAKALDCVRSNDIDQYYEVYFNGAQGDQSILELAKQIPNVEECISADPSKIVLEDLSEVENFGIVGINPRFYIGLKGQGNTVLDGIPSEQRFFRTIRNMQVQIGD